MKKYYQLVLALGVASASLSSCSRSSYSFNTKAPAYLGAEQVRVAKPTAVEEAEASPAVATTEATLPVAAPSPAHQAARALAHHVTAPTVAKAEVVDTDNAPAEASQPAKLNRKELKRQLVAAPKSTNAEGKSQIVAAVLNFFLGFLGIHRFYLGYVGIGILELLTFGVFGILSLIDFIRILIGDLKPKNGEYAKKF